MAYKTTFPVRSVNFTSIKCTEQNYYPSILENAILNDFKKNELKPFNTSM